MRRERSRNKVLNSLKDSPKRFKDLEKETGLSAAGLNDVRKIMLEEKVIELRKSYNLELKGIASSNIRRQIKRLQERNKNLEEQVTTLEEQLKVLEETKTSKKKKGKK